MRFLARSLFVAATLLVAGCAVQNDPSDLGSEDVQLSQDEITRAEKKLVATWNYDTTATDTTKFYNRITFGEDKTYSGYRSRTCAPGMACPAVVDMESGTWHIAGTKLNLRTDKGERKSFTYSITTDTFGLKLWTPKGHAYFKRDARVGESCGGHRIDPVNCEEGLVCFGKQQAWDAPGTCMKPVALGGRCGWRTEETAPCGEGLECRYDGGPRDLLKCAKPKPVDPEGQFCGGIAGFPCPEGYDCKLDGTFPDAGGKCTKSPLGQFCGGIAAIPCPKGYYCQIDATHPDAGGQCAVSKGCDVDGVHYEPGVPFKIDCNTCSCGPDGAIRCTEMACPPKGCDYNGSHYNVGDRFPATDGCNTCECSEGGGVACTKIGCL